MCLSPAVRSVVPPRAHCVSLQSGQSPRVLYPFCVTPEAPESSDSGPSSPSNGPIRKTATVVRECLPASFFSRRISGVTLKLGVAGPPHLRSGRQLLLRSQRWLWGEPLDPGNRTRFSQRGSPFPRSPRHLTETPKVFVQGHHSPPGPSFSCYQI